MGEILTKELYIRRGNSASTQDIIIIGEEQELGSRDESGYRPSKGAEFVPLRKDPYTGAKGLTYNHATPNIKLNTSEYSRDYQVHTFVKKYCSDIVKWDGETNVGRVRSREAFVIRNTAIAERVIEELYARIEDEIHGSRHTITGYRLKRTIRWLILFIPRLLLTFLILLFRSKKSRKRAIKKLWK